VVLVANQRTREALPSKLHGRVLELPENAVDTAQWCSAEANDGDAARFVFIGRLVDWKALDIAIEALREAPRATLDVIGDGPMVPAWRDLAARLQLNERVRFLGWRTQAECADLLAASCALLLPSIYECGGAVVLETMAMSRPVIATAWGGPADYLDASCGILVEPASRAAMVAGFAAAMRQLMESPDLRHKLGSAGRERLQRDFDWSRKIDRIMAIYESCIDA
jgi:glycosyltransferase involved in cell wall biosynthesis